MKKFCFKFFFVSINGTSPSPTAVAIASSSTIQFINYDYIINVIIVKKKHIKINKKRQSYILKR